MLDIRSLTPEYAVAPQIGPEDFAAIAAAGYTGVIDNRPDAEIPPQLHGEQMRRAAEAAGLRFFANPVAGSAMTLENVTAQAAAMDGAQGPVLAYCASGTRSSIVWAFAQAGRMETNAILEATARLGYHLDHLRAQIDSLAGREAG